MSMTAAELLELWDEEYLKMLELKQDLLQQRLGQQVIPGCGSMENKEVTLTLTRLEIHELRMAAMYRLDFLAKYLTNTDVISENTAANISSETKGLRGAVGKLIVAFDQE